MFSEYFGHNVDLHSGGIDLMFPHHQNEESQCCVFHNTNQWVNYWLHAGKYKFFVNLSLEQIVVLFTLHHILQDIYIIGTIKCPNL